MSFIFNLSVKVMVSLFPHFSLEDTHLFSLLCLCTSVSFLCPLIPFPLLILSLSLSLSLSLLHSLCVLFHSTSSSKVFQPLSLFISLCLFHFCVSFLCFSLCILSCFFFFFFLTPSRPWESTAWPIGTYHKNCCSKWCQTPKQHSGVHTNECSGCIRKDGQLRPSTYNDDVVDERSVQ